MSLFKPTKAEVSCSFCGKSHVEVRKLIQGPDVYICDECVTTCADIMHRELGPKQSRPIELAGVLYSLDQFVALTEENAAQTQAEQWDGKPASTQLLVQFSGGVTVRLPISERAHIEKVIGDYNSTV